MARDRTSGLSEAQDAGRRTEPQRLGIDSGEPPGAVEDRAQGPIQYSDQPAIQGVLPVGIGRRI